MHKFNFVDAIHKYHIDEVHGSDKTHDKNEWMLDEAKSWPEHTTNA